MHKFVIKSQNSLFLGYALNDSFHKVYNLETNIVEESINIFFDEVKPNKKMVIWFELLLSDYDWIYGKFSCYISMDLISEIYMREFIRYKWGNLPGFLANNS